MEKVGLLVVGLLGLVLGGQVNRAIYRLAWNSRLIGPWIPSTDPRQHRQWLDFVPVLGWWRLRRESHLHGQHFWVRPLLIELGLAAGLAWLFHWEWSGGLWPRLPGLVALPRELLPRFAAHAVLVCLMTAATFIDLDEKTIPDSITIPGTLFALIWMALFPAALLPDVWMGLLQPLWLSSPLQWNEALMEVWGLTLGLACWSGWIYGLLPKTWWTRSGTWRALKFLGASIVRHPLTPWLLALGTAGAGVITVVWWNGGRPWQGMLTSLVGLAYGGGIVWAVRVVGSAVLGREAMGFGDVTLMAMIGAFLGWQAALLTFFLAPFTGVFIAVAQWVMTGRKDIAFGPFLCSAALIVLVGWRDVWFGYARSPFALGWWITAILAFCLLLMGILLALWQWFVGIWLSRDN